MKTSIKSRCRLLVASALLAASGGCGGASAKYDANVQGTVTIDGELAPGGSVTFTPVEKGPTGVGTIASDGSYSLRIGQGDVGSPDSSEIPSGEYVVTAMITGPSVPSESAPAGAPPPAGRKLIADKYSSRATSDLKFEVKKGPNIIVLELDGPWANPPMEEASDDKAATSAAEGEQESAKADSSEGATAVGNSETVAEIDEPAVAAEDEVAKEQEAKP
jgi:hypothetical protein